MSFETPNKQQKDKSAQLKAKSLDTQSEGKSMAPPPFQLKADSLTNTAPAAKSAVSAQGVVQAKIDDNYPWEGAIVDAWSAALRRDPHKDPNDPHGNTLADLPKDSRVTVIGRNGNWLRVKATVNGAEMVGFVSQELVNDTRGLDTAETMTGMIGEEATWRGSGPGSATTFESWASAPTETAAPPLGASTVINCWEMVLYAGYKAGSISWSWIHDLYAGSGQGAFPDGWEAIMSPDTAPYVPGSTLLNRGELIFFDGISHVALATGNKDEIITFWPPPDVAFDTSAPGYATLDKVKTSSIKELSDWMSSSFGAAPVVTHGHPGW